MRRLLVIAGLCAAGLAHSAQQSGADPFATVKIDSTAVSGTVHMMTGAGGNVAVSIGPDGTLIVDDQYEPLAERILAAIEAIGGAAPRLVVNTHFHGDHVGGNPFFGRTGIIVAQANVFTRLANAPEPPRQLPVVTFDDTATLRFNGDEIALIHLPAGHTDGDIVVWFKGANVVHMGDHFFNGRFPYVDLESGGSVDGYVANVERVIGMVPGDVHVVPGHGPLARLEDLVVFRNMLVSTRDLVRERLDSGESVEAIVTAGLGSEWAEYGTGFVTPERWVRTIEASGRPADRGRRATAPR